MGVTTTGSLLGPGTLRVFSITDKGIFDHSIFRNQTETEARDRNLQTSKFWYFTYFWTFNSAWKMILRTKEGIWYYFTSFISPWSIADQKKIFSSPKIYNVKGFFRQWNFVNAFFLRCPGFFFYRFNYHLWAINNRLDGHLVHLPVKQFIKTV